MPPFKKKKKASCLNGEPCSHSTLPGPKLFLIENPGPLIGSAFSNVKYFLLICVVLISLWGNSFLNPHALPSLLLQDVGCSIVLGGGGGGAEA